MSDYKLWLLKPREDIPIEDDPWYERANNATGFVVRAKTETKARRIADIFGGDENGYGWSHYFRLSRKAIHANEYHHYWLDPAYVTCEELTPDGKPGLILRDLEWQ